MSYFVEHVRVLLLICVRVAPACCFGEHEEAFVRPIERVLDLLGGTVISEDPPWKAVREARYWVDVYFSNAMHDSKRIVSPCSAQLDALMSEAEAALYKGLRMEWQSSSRLTT